MRVVPFVVGAGIVVAGVLWRGPRIDTEKVEPPEERAVVRVEVLNGSGVNLAGLGLAESLRAEGFDVVDICNADHADYATTQVIARGTDPEGAREVAKHMEIGGILVEPDPALILEVTVILGKDRAGRYGVAR